MNEERWHNFAKEKPSEDMEGRNFIVSNGHYEKIATWCGYWENEPFMGDRLCDEVVRWKFYFTPEEEKANEATRTEPKPMKCDELKQVENPIEWGLYYDKAEVDEAIAELKARMQLDDDEMAGFLQLEEECGGGDLRNYIAELKQELSEKDKDIAYWREEYDKETQLTDALKDEIESLKASHYAESVDEGMENRKLKRALWLTRALRARDIQRWWIAVTCSKTTERACNVWKNVERKCRAKAEEYK